MGPIPEEHGRFVFGLWEEGGASQDTDYVCPDRRKENQEAVRWECFKSMAEW